MIQIATRNNVNQWMRVVIAVDVCVCICRSWFLVHFSASQCNIIHLLFTLIDSI